MEYVRQDFPTFVDSVMKKKKMFVRIGLLGDTKIIDLHET